MHPKNTLYASQPTHSSSLQRLLEDIYKWVPDMATATSPDENPNGTFENGSIKASERIESESEFGWRLLDLNEWAPSPIGCLSLGEFPNLDMPPEFGDVAYLHEHCNLIFEIT